MRDGQWVFSYIKAPIHSNWLAIWPRLGVLGQDMGMLLSHSPAGDVEGPFWSLTTPSLC